MSNQLDTRELQEQLEELENQKAAYDEAVESVECAEEALENYLRNKEKTDEPTLEQVRLEADVQMAVRERDDAEMGDEELDELTALQELKEEVGGEWKYGVQLIPESEFLEYCEELCEDIGDIPKDIPSYIVIDWEATANNIKQDYSSTTFRGEDYLYRA